MYLWNCIVAAKTDISFVEYDMQWQYFLYHCHFIIYSLAVPSYCIVTFQRILITKHIPVKKVQLKLMKGKLSKIFSLTTL